MNGIHKANNFLKIINNIYPSYELTIKKVSNGSNYNVSARVTFKDGRFFGRLFKEGTSRSEIVNWAKQQKDK